MQTKQHFGFWIGLAFVAFLLSPLIRSGAAMERFVVEELAQTRAVMGEYVTTKAMEAAGVVFQTSPMGIIATGAKRNQMSAADHRLSKEAGGAAGAALSSLFDSYMQGMMMQCYIVVVRLAIFFVWLVMLIPLLWAAAHDGFMQRRVKRAEFGALRPATFTLASIIVVPMVSLPLIYLVMPFAMSPLLIPLWGVLVALPLSVLVSNMQPLFGR